MTKILVIDDDDAFRGMLTATLVKKGFEVVQAATGAMGVQMARTHLPDIILCDVNMQGVSGNLTLYALRRDPVIAPIPFVLMSGFIVGGDAPPGIERGADGFLVKPISTEKLLSTIQQCVSKSEPASARGRDLAGDAAAAAGAQSSPDLLQPLNRILDITRLLGTARPPLQPKEITDLAGQAHQAAAQLHRRIENCLLYAEVECLASDWQRQAALQEQRTDVRVVAEPAAREKAVALQRAADLSLDFQDVVLPISASHLKKIVLELLDNAFRFSRAGTQVLLQTAKDAEQVTLSVGDQGCGMTPEQIAEAGNPIPLDQALLVRHGSGLSLALVRRLTELHGGHFQIRSEPGRGTTVTLNLPVPK
jgi:two-component system, sensor histidine kinase and response regulator